jgi:imidazoleglycerol phosphate synthase glutamine amidotransferase subunit HisH
VVFPGQGAFGDCALALHRHGAALTRALADHLAADRPYLGICLGLQVLFEGSDEAPGRAGSGILPGDVVRFCAGAPTPRASG